MELGGQIQVGPHSGAARASAMIERAPSARPNPSDPEAARRPSRLRARSSKAFCSGSGIRDGGWFAEKRPDVSRTKRRAKQGAPFIHPIVDAIGGTRMFRDTVPRVRNAAPSAPPGITGSWLNPDLVTEPDRRVSLATQFSATPPAETQVSLAVTRSTRNGPS